MKNAARLANPSVRLRSDCEAQPPIGGAFKRGFDIVGAIAGIVLLSPLFAHAGDAGEVFGRRPRVLRPSAASAGTAMSFTA